MTEKTSYDKCLEAMFGLRRFGIKLGLDVIRGILNGLDNPQDKLNTVHIAGSNGKGSVASALSNILINAGYDTGLYTSPHLVRFNERICINRKPITDDKIVSSYQTVKQLHTGEREPTFFEYTTAMALYEFYKQKVQWAVIETGMGGRLDATNILSPALCIITNISIEHSAYLGDTLEAVAGEKAGIIKPAVPVVTAVKNPEAITVIEKIAKSQAAPLYRLGHEFSFKPRSDQLFDYQGIFNTWDNVKIGLAGSHQMENAALTLAACELLKNKAEKIADAHIKSGIHLNRWPGRLEVVSESPCVILDGAHNLDAAKNLADFLRSKFGTPDTVRGSNHKAAQKLTQKLTIVIGVLDDKPYEKMFEHLLPLCSRVILTQPAIDRAVKAKNLCQTAKKHVEDVTTIPDVAKALHHAIDTSEPEDAICVAGSLYVVGEAKAELEKQGIDSFKLYG